MEILEKSYGPAVVLAPVGRIDLASGDAFQSRLLEVLGRGNSGACLTLLDFAQVEYISSIGLRALMVAAKQTKARQGKLAVANLTSVVKEIFDISRFSMVVPVFEGTAEALAWMSEEAAAVYRSATPRA